MEKHLQLLRPAREFPRPPSGAFAFHALTRQGVFRAETREVEIKQESHPLHGLFEAFHEVVTQMRLGEERRTPTAD
jgi:hypothetical protein